MKDVQACKEFDWLTWWKSSYRIYSSWSRGQSCGLSNQTRSLIMFYFGRRCSIKFILWVFKNEVKEALFVMPMYIQNHCQHCYSRICSSIVPFQDFKTQGCFVSNINRFMWDKIMSIKGLNYLKIVLIILCMLWVQF